MSSNYPPGTGPNDPKAPWNQPEKVYDTCTYCDGTGKDPDFIQRDACRECRGKGEIEVDAYPEPYDEDYD